MNIVEDTYSETRDGMIVSWDVPIVMDDGIVLRADVFRPCEPGRYPAIMNHGPYGKGRPFQQSHPEQWRALLRDFPEVVSRSSGRYQVWETVDPERWVPAGYVCVRVDSRGAARSPGVFDIRSPRETADFHACIEWAAQQEWSNGRIGLAGISYYATNQYQVAATQPPHLAAICPWEGAADCYRDIYYHGGIRCDNAATWFAVQKDRVQHGLGTRAARSELTGRLIAGPETASEDELEATRVDLGEVVRDRPLLDEWYAARLPDWSRVGTPMLSSANWGGQGQHTRGNFEAFTEAAASAKWLEVHGLEHWSLFYSDYGVDLQMRFFDHHLKGTDNGWERTPPVRLHVRSVDDSFVERTEVGWPIPRTVWVAHYLDVAGRALRAEPGASPSSIALDPLGEGVTLMTPPFVSETEITGPMAARLFISSEGVDADVFVTLTVLDPEGSEVTFRGSNAPFTPFAQGWLRASHRSLDDARSLPYRPYHRHDSVTPLEPGETYALDVEIWPSSVVVPRGYRLALHVLGRDYVPSDAPADYRLPFSHADPQDRPASRFGQPMTLRSGGSTPSHVLLPVVPTSNERGSL